MSNLAQSTYWVSSDVLSLILQLRNSQDLPGADVLQRRVLGLFDTMMQNGRNEGLPEQDMTDVKYALAAFTDEVIYHSSWPGRTEWLNNPLQLQFFQENTAGDGFFDRLDKLATTQRDHVTQIYFLCLALGFQGRYRLQQQQQQQLAPLVESVGNHVARAVGGSGPLAPNAERRDGSTSAVRRELPFIAIAIGILILAVLIILVLKLVVGSSADSVVDAIKKVVPQ